MNRWHLPSKEYLLQEFRQEPSVACFFERVTGLHYVASPCEMLIEAYLEAVQTAESVSIKGRQITAMVGDIPAREDSTYEDVERIVTSYGGPKDWAGIYGGLRAGESFPMPMVLRQPGGDLVALGGRTRLSAAALLGIECRVICFDEVELKRTHWQTRLTKKLAIFALFPDLKDYAKAYTLFILGVSTEKPVRPVAANSDDIDRAEREAADIKKSLGSR